MGNPRFHTTLSLPIASAGSAGQAWQIFLSALAGEQRVAVEHAQNGTSSLADNIGSCFVHSPYLARLAASHPDLILAVLENKYEAAWESLIESISPYRTPEEAAIMQFLRIAKSRAALLIGLCDLLGFWPLETVTSRLSQLAERCLMLACDFLLLRAFEKKEIILPNPDLPSSGSGLIILGMGKLGAGELNYSSDIDLIILFDKEQVRYTGRHNPQHFFSRLALDLVRLMQERTSHGYVFRTDLRLRPDPASTPPANSVAAAYTYYETVGQNWERAALIKARPVAGDLRAGENFLGEIRSFIWRKNLDFAAIADIQSIRRQMNGRRESEIDLAGFNIKLGQGGIREIEFFTQIHQLIWGGRRPELRLRPTCATLTEMAETGLIEKETSQQLIANYIFYRHIEHRLQMQEDEQTHTLPKAFAFDKFTQFCGYAEPEGFKETLLAKLHYVHETYSGSFQGPQSLSNQGNLVFTGVEHDAATLETIRLLGYSSPQRVSETIRAWHHGQRRSTRTKRARELITELTPMLLKALAATAQPDEAFLRFDRFIAGVPAGIQLFSLFQMNPHLLELIAEILGSAPALADLLSKHPFLLDAVLSPEFHAPLFTGRELDRQLDEMLALARDFEDAFTILVRFRQEKLFQSSVQFLRELASLDQFQHFLTDLAEVILQKAVDRVLAEFVRLYGVLPDSRFGILGLGRLGAREVAYDSDLDIIFLYDAADANAASDGERALTAPVYFNRLAQRIMTTLTALTAQGRLYELDTRLRPSGNDGPLAVNLEAFDQYFHESAWMFERMALCKARMVYGDAVLQDKTEASINRHLSRAQPLPSLRSEVEQMRDRVTQEFGSEAPWDVKHAPGGLMDLDFFAEYLLLSHPEHTGLRVQSSHEIYLRADALGMLAQEDIQLLHRSIATQNRFLNLSRLCYGGIRPHGLSAALTDFISKHMHQADFNALKTELLALQNRTSMLFHQHLHTNLKDRPHA